MQIGFENNSLMLGNWIKKVLRKRTKRIIELILENVWNNGKVKDLDFE